MDTFRHRLALTAALAAVMLSGAISAPDAQAQSRSKQSDPYSIMNPEPGFPGVIPPRKSMAHPLTPSRPPRRSATQPTTIPQAAPPTIVPGLSQSVPNLQPVPRGSVPGGGTETFNDRAIRCSQQSGMFNVPTGSVGTYMHSCAMGP